MTPGGALRSVAVALVDWFRRLRPSEPPTIPIRVIAHARTAAIEELDPALLQRGLNAPEGLFARGSAAGLKAPNRLLIDARKGGQVSTGQLQHPSGTFDMGRQQLHFT